MAGNILYFLPNTFGFFCMYLYFSWEWLLLSVGWSPAVTKTIVAESLWEFWECEVWLLVYSQTGMYDYQTALTKVAVCAWALSYGGQIGCRCFITSLTATISKRGCVQAQNYPTPPLHTCYIIQSVFTQEDLLGVDRKMSTLSPLTAHFNTHVKGLFLLIWVALVYTIYTVHRLKH